MECKVTAKKFPISACGCLCLKTQSIRELFVVCGKHPENVKTSGMTHLSKNGQNSKLLSSSAMLQLKVERVVSVKHA